MTRHPGNRLLAWLVDWACILVWAAVTAAVGVPLYLSGVTRDADPVVLNLVSALVLIVPVTLVLSWLEAGRREGTLGKSARRLRVTDARSGSRISFGRALGRNLLKLAVPWAIGHAAVYAIVESSATGSPPVGVWVLTAAAYLLPIVYVISLFIGSGRTPYDRAAGTVVIRD